jgi:predicted phosphohydrolase
MNQNGGSAGRQKFEEHTYMARDEVRVKTVVTVAGDSLWLKGIIQIIGKDLTEREKELWRREVKAVLRSLKRDEEDTVDFAHIQQEIIFERVDE